MTTLLRNTIGDFCRCWKPLILADIAYKITAFSLLTPLVAILFRAMIAASGNTVLSDQDIVFFFLSPAGWVCLISVGALTIGITALELTVLLAILATGGNQQRVRILDAFWFAAMNAWPVIKTMARVVALTLLVSAPFLALAAAVYFSLLTEFDINYYLREKPPVFLASIGIGLVLVVTLLGLLLRLYSGWFYALPLVLFEEVQSSKSLRLSQQRASGQRRKLVLWMLGWVFVTTVLSTLATTLVVEIGRYVVPAATRSLELLTIVIGASLLLWGGVNLAVNLLSTTTFAAIHYNLYQHLGSDGSTRSVTLRLSENRERSIIFRITPKRLLAVGIVGIVAATAVGLFAVQTLALQDDVQIIAHRGASSSAPENTMAALKRAIEDQADWVEIDVQETADGTVVVFHDSDFMKLAGKNLKIWNATMSDLEDLDVGSWFGSEFKSERVPTLDAVLDECKGKLGVTIELKYYGHDQQLEKRVVEIVEKHGMTANVELMSLKMDAVKKMRSLRRSWKVGLLMSIAAGDLKKIDADFLAVNASFVNRPFIRDAHDSEKKVYVWTVNDAVTMSTMIGRGVDGLITDEPALARWVLQQRAQMSSTERLLLELAGIFGVKRQIVEQ